MNPRKSVQTIDNPQFIDLQPLDVNPLMSKGKLKVFYLGQNRNGSAINRETATRMSKTLRGCPIVGWYKKEKEDFMDHGDQLVLDGEGAHFNVLTKPYGFIAPDAKVWFQFYEDTDEFGNACMREYLVTECYLWTEQFPECKQVIENNNPHSMELDDETLKGHWATDNNSGLEFFIIDDAIFSKLCILGEDVEPCFEGSMFLPEETSSNFSKNDFLKELTTMAKELKFALSNNEGGLSMEVQNEVIEQSTVEEIQPVETENNETVENSSFEADKNSETTTDENAITVEEFAKEEKEDKKEEEQEEGSTSEEKEDEDKDEKSKSKNSLEENSVDVAQLQADFSELQKNFASLEEENKQLRAFKQEIEDKQKDDLINSFYMLSDEDKKDVIENKTNYSLDEIESKLSVICVRKKVNFDLDEEKKSTSEEESVATVFNLNSTEADNIPAWIKAVEDVKNRNND